MKWETEIMSNSRNWMMDDSLKSTIWTPVENKLFENALAKFDSDTPDRWQKVAEMVPGKTVADVIRQYKELEDDVSSIEAGYYPKYRYKNNNNCSFTLSKSPPYSGGVMRLPFDRTVSVRSIEQERKKGVPWTEEEHKLFLLGLKKYGKGDWRNISRNYVMTRTPTQVASHAQKYFIRQLSGGKDKRRASIHDITTVNVNESQSSSPKIRRTSPEHCKFQWIQSNCGGGGGGVSSAFHQTNGGIFRSSPYIDSVGFKKGGDNGGVDDGGGGAGGGGLNIFYGSPPSMVFQVQPAMHYPYG